MSYAEDVSRHRRLAILRQLAEVQEYVSNASVLQDILVRLGLPVSYDSLMTELHWLREQGMVAFDPDAGFVVVTATRRGVDIARGLAVHPGVQRPRPRI
ncbi:VpaChn25_0724 family phage protein [Paracoccus jiaweipingae]|uniref:VpaChn25_0724 family phage protein n=1 Tax=Paracoccus sp. p2-l61 TaxID=3366950 RepID=UPI0037AE9DF1